MPPLFQTETSVVTVQQLPSSFHFSSVYKKKRVRRSFMRKYLIVTVKIYPIVTKFFLNYYFSKLLYVLKKGTQFLKYHEEKIQLLSNFYIST